MIIGVIGVATIHNMVCALWASWRRGKHNTSTAPVPSNNGLLFRTTGAIATALRNFSYRWRIPGVSMNMLEVVLTILYTVVLFLLNFGWGTCYTSTTPFRVLTIGYSL